MTLVLQSTNREIVISLDDPLYKTFIVSLQEVDGTLPSSVTLPAYVLAQYDNWLRLKNWMALGPCMFYKDHQGTNEELRTRAPSTVFLADVVVIIRTLFDPPVGWERFVAVDNRTPQSERKIHHLTVGRMVRADWGHEYHAPCLSEATTSLYDDFSMTEDPAKHTGPLLVSIREALHAIDEYTILQGMRHNALLQMIGRCSWGEIYSCEGGQDPDWLLINWQDVLDYAPFDWVRLKQNEYEKALSIDRRVPSCVYAYAGVPLQDDPAPLYGPRVAETEGALYCEIVYGFKDAGTMWVQCSHFALLYDRAIASLQENGRPLIGSRDLGVLRPDTGVYDSSKRYRADIYSLLRILTMRAFSRKEPCTYIVGTLGLSALSLFVNIVVREKWDGATALQFIAQSQAILEEHGGVGGFVELP